MKITLSFTNLPLVQRNHANIKMVEQYRTRTITVLVANPAREYGNQASSVVRLNKLLGYYDNDIELLKEKDPFLYRSIPAFHRAMLLHHTVNHTQLLMVNEDPLEDESKCSNSEISIRKTRMSTECHPEKLLENSIRDDDDDDDELLSMEELINMVVRSELINFMSNLVGDSTHSEAERRKKGWCALFNLPMYMMYIY